ncbi:MAG: 3-phosphoshikimate 1-carboxyvinyltransferase [Carbonactinosporaceae bacterium]
MSAALWPAPTASAPVDAAVTMPGSKSLTNRALVLAALAAEPSTIRRPLHSRDTELMVAGLRALGVEIDERADAWAVTPHRLRGPARVDVGNSGTVMRFLLPVAALAAGEVHFDGDPRARERPLLPLVAGLRDLGVRIDDGGRGSLPLTVLGAGTVPGGAVTIDASPSSQFVSALLLAAPRFGEGLTVRHEGPAVPSLPHIAMTIDLLRETGAAVDDTVADRWRVRPGPLRGRDVLVEPDLSNAAPFLAAALVTGGRVTVVGWPERTTQAGDALRTLLTRMGGHCQLGSEGLTVTGSGRVHGIDADLHESGELTPVIAAAVALADSPSTLRGIAHLRAHETDRLAALAKELGNLGGDVRDTADRLQIRPRPLHGGVFATYDDHRLATAAAVIGLAVPGVQVENVATTAKTLPGFAELWSAMLGGAH